jgi:hypothetical protein
VAETRKNETNALAKEQRARDGKKAMSEYEADAIALRARTERLKALRLARDANEPPPPEKPAMPAKKKGGTKKKAKDKGKLSEWLHGQQTDGRRS